VRRLVHGTHHTAGAYNAAWNLIDRAGQKVASGVYFVRLNTLDAVRVQRLTVLR
jgi:hypothetical protein